jgi:tRNA(Ile)-lysidine synthase
MALAALLRDLHRLHHWRLTLWHGDHRWRQGSAADAAALLRWAEGQGLPCLVEQAPEPPRGEAAARQWRYGRLARAARRLGCRHVVTGHTATDRAETVLLNLARGSHRRGLGSLRAHRPLVLPGERGVGELWLCRPLLIFCRSDTARLCRTLALPVWLDPSNEDPAFRRNRVRAEVLPVLEELHPGAGRRISAQAERLAEDQDQTDDLLDLALAALAAGGEGAGGSLDRRRLAAQRPANQRRLLQRWLERRLGSGLEAESLEQLASRLRPDQGPGRLCLPDGWQLRWDSFTLSLLPPTVSDG